MKHFSWQVRLGLSLIVASFGVYAVHYIIFEDIHHILIYTIGDIAFLPIEVLFVTLIIHSLLGKREKRAMLEKLNMVIGAFFSEVGTELLAYMSDHDPKLDDIRKDLIVKEDWSGEEFLRVNRKLREYDYDIKMDRIEARDLRRFLIEKKEFLLQLLVNPNLLEHESFTELLRAVFHMTEEFVCRKDVEGLPTSDCEHLEVDIKRVYTLLVHEWLDYMRYLKDSYPHLFSLAMRMNPFDREASPIVK